MVGFARGQGEVVQTPGPTSLRNDYKNKVIKQGTKWAILAQTTNLSYLFVV